MKNLLALSVFACILLSGSATFFDDPDATGMQPTFIQALLQSDIIKQKINNVIDFLDLNVHYVRLLKTLFTTENLILLRRTLEWSVSISNVVIKILPENPTQPNIISLVTSLFPIIDEANNGIDDDDGFDALPSQIVLSSVAADNVSNRYANVLPSEPLPVSTQAPLEGIVTPKITDTVTKATEEVEKIVYPVVDDTDSKISKLTPEEMKVLEGHGISPDQAVNLATMIYRRADNEDIKHNAQDNREAYYVENDADDTPIVMDINEYLRNLRNGRSR